MMGNIRKIVVFSGVFILLLSLANLNAQTVQTKTTQTGTKSKQVNSKTKQSSKSAQKGAKTVKPEPKAEPAKKVRDPAVITIGLQNWALANLNVGAFRNGDTIPEAKSNKEWVSAGDAGKPAWCYYNNDLAIGKKYGKLYNWYAVNDPRGLAPDGWAIASDEDWTKLANYLGGHGGVGTTMKSITGWDEGYNGTNQSGFTGFPGGYRIENGLFQNIGSTGIWWTSTENKSHEAFDHYLASGANLGRSSSPRQRGESVRCLKQ